jgi:hypothetical protein
MQESTQVFFKHMIFIDSYHNHQIIESVGVSVCVCVCVCVCVTNLSKGFHFVFVVIERNIMSTRMLAGVNSRHLSVDTTIENLLESEDQSRPKQINVCPSVRWHHQSMKISVESTALILHRSTTLASICIASKPKLMYVSK